MHSVLSVESHVLIKSSIKIALAQVNFGSPCKLIFNQKGHFWQIKAKFDHIGSNSADEFGQVQILSQIRHFWIIFSRIRNLSNIALHRLYQQSKVFSCTKKVWNLFFFWVRYYLRENLRNVTNRFFFHLVLGMPEKICWCF